MDSQLALIGSILIGTLLLFSVFNLQSDIKEHSYRQMQDLSVQNTAMAIIEQLQEDFRQIGYGVNYPPLAIFALDSITFYADLGDDGSIDTVNYRVSTPAEASGTPNPNDRIFYRWSNSEPILNAAFGVTNFQLRFFDQNGYETTNQLQIKTIEVTLEFEGTSPFVTLPGTREVSEDYTPPEPEYAKFYWCEKITPLNLQPL